MLRQPLPVRVVHEAQVIELELALGFVGRHGQREFLERGREDVSV
jgi:hypothetical protein